MSFDPASRVQDYLVFGEFGDVNPSITDSSTYTFLSPERMEELFEHEIEGCFLYSRHFNPTNKYLASALVRMEDGEAAQVMASGMGAISTTLMTLCAAGDEIVCGRSIYGGTYALLKNLLPRFGVTTRFVDLCNREAVRAAMTPRTRVLYCESLSNPLLEVSDLPQLAELAHAAGARLVVDNTFTPMILSPLRHGADVVVHSLTKFINGTSDCVAGCVVSTREFIGQLNDINSGPSMLFGPVLDSARAASILKNLHSLHIRLRQHGSNALHLATSLTALGYTVHYPGLETHPQHELLARLMNPGYGWGGMMTFDAGDHAAANRLMTLMQRDKVGYLAVSLGYFKTLFTTPGHSTSSEIPFAEREAAGLREGLIRFSIGLDADIAQTTSRILDCLSEAGISPGSRPAG
ncbi:MAG: Methionine gamma-lyase [Candidatus Accumulibacter adjunctus]|uniref:Methionine gamma-lyase n=1 Tax=Candidatus Accumulibacter adjunctus TaxID=1454001 RepID=A0A011M9H9_9PROT|nr:MAG: Methionine gamma-lyase [Candidatus Accumulibacter adjunctus]